MDVGRYRTIVADPPWRYGKWGSGSSACKYVDKPFNVDAGIPYPTMTAWEIGRLPVESMAADDCDLYLWTTQRYMPDAFGIIDAWGFKYSQILTWCKEPMGTGQGGLYCPTTEFVLIGRKGKMPTGKQRINTTWWKWPRAWKKHSRKPDAFFGVIEQASDAPRIELFARQRREGWDAWGDEVVSDVYLGLIRKTLKTRKRG